MSELPYQRAFHKIRSEFFATPDARLTAVQAEGLAGVDRAVCRTVLEDLVRAGFLTRLEGSYGMHRPTTRARASTTATSPDKAEWKRGGDHHHGGHQHP